MDAICRIVQISQSRWEIYFGLVRVFERWEGSPAWSMRQRPGIPVFRRSIMGTWSFRVMSEEEGGCGTPGDDGCDALRRKEMVDDFAPSGLCCWGFIGVEASAR